MTQTRYVNTASSAGGDGTSNLTSGSTRAYPTLSAAENALPASLTEPYIINCCGTAADSTSVNFTGVTTSASNYIQVQGNTGDSAGRHNGVYSTSKYRLEVGVDYVHILGVDAAYIRFIGIQVRQTNSSTNAYGPVNITTTAGASSALLFESCLIRCGTTATNDTDGSCVVHGGGTCIIRNCVIYGGYNCVVTLWNNSAPNLTIQNSTICKATVYGVYDSGSTSACTNVYSGGNSNDYQTVDSFTTCMSADAATRTGVTNNIAFTTANFTNVSANTEDLHITSSSALKNVGTDLSGTFTTDIDNETRPTGANTWDIGADEYVAAGPQCPITYQLGPTAGDGSYTYRLGP